MLQHQHKCLSKRLQIWSDETGLLVLGFLVKLLFSTWLTSRRPFSFSFPLTFSQHHCVSLWIFTVNYTMDLYHTTIPGFLSRASHGPTFSAYFRLTLPLGPARSLKVSYSEPTSFSCLATSLFPQKHYRFLESDNLASFFQLYCTLTASVLMGQKRIYITLPLKIK